MKTLNEYINESINEGWWPFGKKKDEKVKPNKVEEYKKWERELNKILMDNSDNGYVVGDFVPDEDFWVNDRVMSKYNNSMAIGVTNHEKDLSGYFVLDIDKFRKYSNDAREAEKVLKDKTHIAQFGWTRAKEIRKVKK